MNCPVCNMNSLSNIDLEEKLIGCKCSNCEGHWIKGYQYWKWLKTNPGLLLEKPIEFSAELPVEDSGMAKICIECGHLMIRNKVGHGISFYLDRYSSCGGIWFDKNEWETLKSRNLHDEIHQIFTAAWQKDNRARERQAYHEGALVDEMGQKDFDDLKRLKSVIDNNPKKDLIIGYLLHGPK